MADSVTTSADGVVHIVAEYELPADEQDEPEDAAPADEPNGATEALKSAGRAVGKLLRGIFEALKPEDRPAPAEPEEE